MTATAGVWGSLVTGVEKGWQGLKTGVEEAEAGIEEIGAAVVSGVAGVAEEGTTHSESTHACCILKHSLPVTEVRYKYKYVFK